MTSTSSEAQIWIGQMDKVSCRADVQSENVQKLNPNTFKR